MVIVIAELLRGLLVNTSLLITTVWVGTMLVPQPSHRNSRPLTRHAPLLIPIALGLLLMQFPVSLGAGTLIDLRNVAPALTALFGGPLAATPVALSLSAYRLYLGGAGAMPGVAGIAIAVAAGSLLRLKLDASLNLRQLFWRCLAIYAVTQLNLLLTPETGVATFRTAYLPLVFFQTGGSLLIGQMLKVRLQALQQEHSIRRLAETDHLTGLFNVRVLDQVLNTRTGEQADCVLLLDLDHFKRINDTYGHSVGDRVLQQCAAVLKRGLRDKDWLFRYGGEEFVVLLHQCDLRAGLAVAERMRQAIAECPISVPGGSSVRVTLSGGLAELPREQPAREALDRADALLYMAKAQGRNRIVAA